MNAYGRLVLVISLLAVHVSPGVAQQTIHIRLAEAYAAQIDIGIGKAERSNGADTLRGTLTRQPDGTWTGEVDAKVSFDQAMGGILAQGCPSQPFEGTQRLKMSGKPVSGFNSKVQSIPQSVRPVEFLLLSVRPAPAAAPKMTKGDINCLSMYTYEDGSQLLPLNDSRWLPEAGYTIGLPQRGVLEYADSTIALGDGGPDLPVKALALWKVHVERP
ncbi:MAG TPA: hypothetical protein VFJ92_12060 [Gemmatimonadales bacterium]|nr:hypothetical protein [Gemmatimonadales bacterium]